MAAAPNNLDNILIASKNIVRMIYSKYGAGMTLSDKRHATLVSMIENALSHNREVLHLIEDKKQESAVVDKLHSALSPFIRTVYMPSFIKGYRLTIADIPDDLMGNDVNLQFAINNAIIRFNPTYSPEGQHKEMVEASSKLVSCKA